MENGGEVSTRCLLVGVGGMGRALIRFLEQKPWFEPVGVVDLRGKALAEAQTALHLPDEALFKDLDDALSATSPDAAIINTPSELHYEQSKAALKVGAHVLVAKPITNEFGQAEPVGLADGVLERVVGLRPLRLLHPVQHVVAPLAALVVQSPDSFGLDHDTACAPEFMRWRSSTRTRTSTRESTAVRTRSFLPGTDR